MDVCKIYRIGLIPTLNPYRNCVGADHIECGWLSGILVATPLQCRSTMTTDKHICECSSSPAYNLQWLCTEKLRLVMFAKIGYFLIKQFKFLLLCAVVFLFSLLLLKYTFDYFLQHCKLHVYSISQRRDNKSSSRDEIPERDVTYHHNWLLIYHWTINRTIHSLPGTF